MLESSGAGVSKKVRKLISKGNRLENSRKHKHAEKVYLQAIQEIGDSNPILVGILHINLGTNAMRHKRLEEAIRYNLRAIELLKDYKGEAILQSAHANWNIAYCYDSIQDSRVVDYAAEAVRLFSLYPFTMAADLANAKGLYVNSKAYFRKELNSAELNEAWQSIRSLSFKSLYPEVVVNFLGIYLATLHASNIEQFETTALDAENWAKDRMVSHMINIMRGE